MSGEPDIRVCDRCNYRDTADSEDAPEYVPALESTLCPGCKEKAGAEVQG